MYRLNENLIEESMNVRVAIWAQDISRLCVLKRKFLCIGANIVVAEIDRSYLLQDLAKRNAINIFVLALTTHRTCQNHREQFPIKDYDLIISEVEKYADEYFQVWDAEMYVKSLLGK